MTVRLVLGLLFTVVAFAVAGRRVWWLSRLIRTGQPAPGRLDGVPARLRAEVAEVFGQRKLLKWSVPGVAHFLTFWGFVVLILTIIEAWGALFDRDFHIPLIGRWPAVGFLEDLFAVGVLVGIVTFAILRLAARAGPASSATSRFYGSHTRAGLGDPRDDLAGHHHPADLPRGADQHRRLPVRRQPVGVRVLDGGQGAAPAGRGRQRASSRRCSCSAKSAVILGFLVIVVYSKHLHIALAPLNVGAKRLPDGLGPLLPVTDAAGKPIDFEDAETSTRTRSSAAARSRTSPGRACSTSPPAPSAAAASRSARPGTPASRCRRSS